jgi:hypothetical protein
MGDCVTGSLPFSFLVEKGSTMPQNELYMLGKAIAFVLPQEGTAALLGALNSASEGNSPCE